MTQPLVFVVIVFAVAAPSYGYIDPGTGHLLWQAIMAALLGGAFYFRKIFSFPFRNKKR